MVRPQSKKEVDILEGRGHWEASSYLHKIVKRLLRKNAPLEMRYVKDAHRIIFTIANQKGLAGKYRRHNGPELRRIDGSILKIADWQNVPNLMAELDSELRERTRDIKKPRTDKGYKKVIEIAARLSHRLAFIHPFENGNGRASRLLMNAILLRAGLSEIAIKKSKDKYLRAMRQADDDDFTPLENLILEGLIDVRRKIYTILRRKQAELSKRYRLRKRR